MQISLDYLQNSVKLSVLLHKRFLQEHTPLILQTHRRVITIYNPCTKYRIIKMIQISENESKSIDSLRCLCVMAVVMLHSKLVSVPDIAPKIPQVYWDDLEMWYSLPIIPPSSLSVLFILSGYLYFRSFGSNTDWKKEYIKKNKARIVSLVLLYFTWCNINILIRIIFKGLEVPDLITYIKGFGVSTGDNPTWCGVLWFVRSLIVFSILSPLYYFTVKYLKHYTILLCLFINHLQLDVTLWYFNWYLLLGSYLGYIGLSLTSITEKFNWKISLLIFIVYYLYIKLFGGSGPEIILLVLIFSTFIGLFRHYPLPRFLVQASTFIYVSHFPVNGLLKKIFFKILPHTEFGYVCCMYISCILAILICATAFHVIKRIPVLNYILVGGRFQKKELSQTS